MGFADMPIEYKAPQRMEQLAARRSAEDSFYKELLADSTSGRSKNMTEATNIGQVQRLELPARWKNTGASSTVAGSGYHEFSVDGKDDVKFCFYYRGRRMSEPSSKAFHDILSSAPHTLKPAEMASLTEVLDQKSDPNVFSTLNARTESINGKRVLVVEGRFKEKQFDTMEVFVDSDGTGSAVQEIYYQAPKADYVTYLKDAKDAFKSIVWK